MQYKALLQENNTTLQELINTANTLPPAGGATVQKQTGTFTTDNTGTAIVSTDFIPDVIIVYCSVHNDIEWNMIFSHTEKISTLGTMSCVAQHPNGIYMGQCSIQGKGFGIWVSGMDWSWGATTSAHNKEFNFTVIKYT